MWQILIFTAGIPLLFSALKSLTSVFGMGTGGSSLPSSPLWLYIPLFAAYIRFYVPYLFTKTSEQSSFKKINNYIANLLRKGKNHISSSCFLKSVKIIDFSSLNIKIHSKSLYLKLIEIKPNDLLVSVS